MFDLSSCDVKGDKLDHTVVEVRSDKVKVARAKIELEYYDNDSVLDITAENLLDDLL